MLQNLSWSSVLCSVLTGCCYWCYRICPDLVFVFSVDGLLLLMLQNLSWSIVRLCSVLKGCCYWCYRICPDLVFVWCSVLTDCCYWCYRICPDLSVRLCSVLTGWCYWCYRICSWSSVRLCSVLTGCCYWRCFTAAVSLMSSRRHQLYCSLSFSTSLTSPVALLWIWQQTPTQSLCIWPLTTAVRCPESFRELIPTQRHSWFCRTVRFIQLEWISYSPCYILFSSGEKHRQITFTHRSNIQKHSVYIMHLLLSVVQLW